MNTYKVWEEGKDDEAILVDADNMNEALDIAAHKYKFGYYTDYADMARDREWNEDEGLNIELV